MTRKDSQIPANKLTYLFGEFRLEADTLLLLRNSEIVPLAPKALEVLLALVEAKGKLVTKEEIFNRAWTDAFVEESNLAHHISAIRKSLGKNAGVHTFIETVPRRGYRFIAEVKEVLEGGRETEKEPQSIAVHQKAKVQSALIHQSAPPKILELSANPAMFGRENEVEKIVKLLLEKTGPRLVTLTGVGGTGKTRLAAAVAAKLFDAFADKVVFVELASIMQPDLLASVITQKLVINQSSGDPSRLVEDTLRDRKLLLVLDNFEQIIGAARYVSRWLAIAPRLKILVTSRVPLKIGGEYEFSVLPLDVPARDSSFREINRYGSVNLFGERARRARHDFELTEKSAQSVAEICRRVEGLPLAIELAAARVRVLSARSIAGRLNNQLDLLAGNSAELPSRQQTMRATISWSYDLLTEKEKLLFAKLAVFSGGFTVETAENICLPIGVLDGIESLFENNLIVRNKYQSSDADDDEPRFRMLEVIGEFAAEILQQSSVRNFVRQNHADYFLSLAERAEKELYAARQIEWLNRLDEEYDNLRRALEFYIEMNSENALRMCGALYLFWSLRGHLAEGSTLIERALHIDSSAFLRSKVLNGAGQLARLKGDYLTAQKFYENSLLCAENAADRRQIAVTSQGLAVIAYQQGDTKAAKKHLEAALPLSREIGEEMITFSLLSALGEVARVEDDLETAKACNLECAAFTRRTGNQHQLCGSLINLGAIACLETDIVSAQNNYAEAMRIALRLDIKSHISHCLDGFSAIFTLHKDFHKAALMSGAASQLRQEINYEMETPDMAFCRRYINLLESKLGVSSFNKLFADGKKLSFPEAVDLTMDEKISRKIYTEITFRERITERLNHEVTIDLSEDDEPRFISKL